MPGSKKTPIQFVEIPIPHYIKDSKKEIHGWYSPLKPYGRRDCTSERLLLNPYHGCIHNCFFCYARAFWLKGKEIVVFKDFHKNAALQLDKLSIASCGYLSPVTDPFQPVDKIYNLSRLIIEEFISRNIPVEFITKGAVDIEILEIIKKQKHSFGQVSILTLDENLRKMLTPGGARTSALFENLEKMKTLDIFGVMRIDPILPFINDDMKELEELIHMGVKSGAKHIIASCLDIPFKIKNEIFAGVEKIRKDLPGKYHELYSERLGACLHASINYRHRLFTTLKSICRRMNVTFALCMEFAVREKNKSGEIKVEGLNKYFMTSNACEGIDIPLYKRDGATFKPVKGCDGACLKCSFSTCGVPELSTGGAWKLRDYIRWSRPAEQQTFSNFRAEQ